MSVTSPEWGRLAFIEQRDGKAAAVDFARRVYGSYREVLRHGFMMPGRKRNPDNRRGGRSLTMRRQMVESCMVLRWYLRATVYMKENENG